MDLLTLAQNAPDFRNIDDNIIPILGMCIGGLIALFAIVFGTVKRISQTASRERTKREIAAYVAEGSMSPEDGERIITAQNDQLKC